jgi:hypothetical protein
MGTSLCSFAYMDVGEGREQDAEALPILHLLHLQICRMGKA